MGQQLLGRGMDADFALDLPELSRRHAYLSWDGRSAEILDAGSTNGTSVNGQRIDRTQAQVLRPGDVLSLGDLKLRFDAPAADVTTELPPSPQGPRFANEFRGPNYGPVNQAAHDINFQSWNEFRYEQDDLGTELFQGRGPGRLIAAIGLVVALSGFAVWTYLILSAPNDPNAPSPFERHFLGLPIALVAFGAFGLGGLIAALGGAMSKAARARERSRNAPTAQGW
jgi:hypothetical protein